MSDTEQMTSPHLTAAEAALEAGDLEQAEASFRLHLVAHPDDAYAHNRLGVCLVRDERLQEAADAFEQAIALDPKLARAHTNLGNLRFAAGDVGEAEALHREALRLDPDLAYALENLAAVLKKQKRIGEAVKAQKQAARLHAKQFSPKRRDELSKTKGAGTAAAGAAVDQDTNNADQDALSDGDRLGREAKRQRSWLTWFVLGAIAIIIYYMLKP